MPPEPELRVFAPGPMPGPLSARAGPVDACCSRYAICHSHTLLKKQEAQEMTIHDQNGAAIGMHHEPDYTAGIWAGRRGKWVHEATIRLVPAQVFSYSQFDGIALAHAFLLRHFIGPGKSICIILRITAGGGCPTSCASRSAITQMHLLRRCANH